MRYTLNMATVICKACNHSSSWHIGDNYTCIHKHCSCPEYSLIPSDYDFYTRPPKPLPNIQATLVQAMHYSSDKPGVDQIPPECLIELGKVYSFGEQKYSRDNWKVGMSWHEVYGSMLRHMLAFWSGEGYDQESKLPHLAHAMWNVNTLLYYYIRSIGTDDR